MGTSSLSSRAIIGAFYERLEQGAGGWANLLSFPVESNQESETYKWLGQVPAMREWIGGRQAKGLKDSGITIDNKPFEATLEISVDDLRRDKTGQIMVRVNEMADRANAHWQRLLSTLVINGESAVCYDGQYFFDTDHTEGDSGTQSNDLSIDISTLATAAHGSVSAPSVGEMNQVIMKSIEALYGFKDNQGEPLNENAMNFLVMVPTNLWSTSVSAVGSNMIDNGNTNPFVSTTLSGMNIQIAQNPRLTWTDKLAVFRTDGNVKPFIRQNEVSTQVSAIAEGSELEFKERKHEYGLYASGNVGYGMWQHGVLATMV